MKPQIRKINGASDEKALLLLTKYFKSKKIEVNDLNSCTVKASILNLLGNKFYAGKDNLDKDVETAKAIYKIAMKRGSKWAKYNLADTLLEEKCYPEACKLFEQLYSSSNEWLDKDSIVNRTIAYYAGRHYLRQQNFKDAWDCFTNIPAFIIVNGEKKSHKFSGWAQDRIRDIQKKVLDKLDAIWINELSDDASEDALSSSENSQNEHKPAMAASSSNSEASALTIADDISIEIGEPSRPALERGWYPLSASLQMYDMQYFQGCIADYHRAKVNLKIAEKSVRVANKALDKARRREKPSFIITSLESLKTTQVEKLNQAKRNFAKEKEAYQARGDAGEKKQWRRAVQSEKHFFALERNKNEATLTTAKALLAQRQGTAEEVKSLAAKGIPVRRLITAELAITRAALTIMGSPKDYTTNFPWLHKDIKRYNGNLQYMASNEHIDYGNTRITYSQRINSHSNHIGDFFMEHVGTYGNIYKTLEQVIRDDSGINPAKEKKLAEWMLRFCHSGIPVKLTELQELNDTLDEIDCTRVRQIFYHCLVKEPASWMIPAEENHELPLATSQLRAIRLIAAGYLHIIDVFNSNAKYGVFTSSNIGANIDAVNIKINRINKLYTKKLILDKDENRVKYFHFRRDHPAAVAVSTRAQLHQELKDGFGGITDSDDEGYDSATAESLYPGAYCF